MKLLLLIASLSSNTLYVPTTCTVKADDVTQIHLVLCSAEIECTEKVLKVVCGDK